MRLHIVGANIPNNYIRLNIMKTVNAKQYTNTMKSWQADKAAKQAKKALKDKRQQRQGKRMLWADAE